MSLEKEGARSRELNRRGGSFFTIKQIREEQEGDVFLSFFLSFEN